MYQNDLAVQPAAPYCSHSFLGSFELHEPTKYVSGKTFRTSIYPKWKQNLQDILELAHAQSASEIHDTSILVFEP